jgi:hypothetical protein
MDTRYQEQRQRQKVSAPTTLRVAHAEIQFIPPAKAGGLLGLYFL